MPSLFSSRANNVETESGEREFERWKERATSIFIFRPYKIFSIHQKIYYYFLFVVVFYSESIKYFLNIEAIRNSNPNVSFVGHGFLNSRL